MFLFLAIVGVLVMVLKTMSTPSSKHFDRARFVHLLKWALAWAAILAVVAGLSTLGFALWVNSTDVWRPKQGQYHYHPYAAR